MHARAKRRRIVAFASLGVLAVVIIIAVALASNAPKPPDLGNPALSVGQKAPEFAVSTTAGPFDLANAGGKPTLLEVFATWCPHCQRETSVLNALYAKYKSRVNIVAVSGSPNSMTDQSVPESQADVVAFATKFDVTYPIAFDPDLAVAKHYLGGGFPTVVLIGTNGLVQSIRDGEIPQSDIEKALGLSMAGKKPDPTMGKPASAS